MTRYNTKKCCHICDELVTLNGLGRASHMKKHVRAGIADEVTTPTMRTVYVKGTGEKRYGWE